MELPSNTLKVRYSWRVKILYGFFAINNLFWGILSSISTSISESWSDWIGFGFLFLGGICLAAAVWVWYTPYLSIEGKTIIQPGWQIKRIPLEELDSVRNFAGDLIFESGTTKIKLDKQTAQKEDLESLREFVARELSAPGSVLEWLG